MKLTDEEKKERDYLISLRSNTTIPMFQDKQDRLNYLNRKEFHNNCTNPQCTGCDAKEDEYYCPKCGSDIYKTINQ